MIYTKLDFCLLFMFLFSATREQPIFTTKAHVFQIDPNTKKKWLPTSSQAVNVSYYYDSSRNTYRIISVEGSKVSDVASGSSSVKQNLRIYLLELIWRHIIIFIYIYT